MSDINPDITAAGDLAPAVEWLINEFAEPVVRPNPQRKYVSVKKGDFDKRMSREIQKVLKKKYLWQTASIDYQGSFTRGTTVYVNIQVQIGGYNGDGELVGDRLTYAHANVVAGKKESKKKDSKEIEVKKWENVGRLTIQNALRLSSENQNSQWVVKDGKDGYKITVDDPGDIDVEPATKKEAKQARSVGKKAKQPKAKF